MYWLQAVSVADAVRESLEKHPTERTEYDVEIILNAIQHLQVCYCVVVLYVILYSIQSKSSSIMTQHPKNCIVSYEQCS